MEQCDLISFTSVVAGLLLCKRSLTSLEIINFTSMLSCEGIEVDDNWGIDELESCVDMDYQCSFMIKKFLSYDSVLENGMTVKEFLRSFVDKRVLEIIRRDQIYAPLYMEDSSMIVSQKNDQSLMSPGVEGFSMKKERFLSRVKRRNMGYSFLRGAH